MSEEARALLVRIEGQVQNVGYRSFAQEEAVRLRVGGWIVNRADGAVEAALYGPGAALSELIARLRQGPMAAQVESLDVRSTDRAHVADVPKGGYAF